MKFDFYTEVFVIATPKTTVQGIAGYVGVIMGESSGPLGQQYAVALRDESGSLGEVWMINEDDLEATGRTFTREDFYGDKPSFRVRAQRYTDDDPPPVR